MAYSVPVWYQFSKQSWYWYGQSKSFHTGTQFNFNTVRCSCLYYDKQNRHFNNNKAENISLTYIQRVQKMNQILSFFLWFTSFLFFTADNAIYFSVHQIDRWARHHFYVYETIAYLIFSSGNDMEFIKSDCFVWVFPESKHWELLNSYLKYALIFFWCIY